MNKKKDKPRFVVISGGKLPKDGEVSTMEGFVYEMRRDVLARTLWGEARGEGTAGMQAVARVVLNRVAIAEAKGDFWWGKDIIQICQKPYQFSCWNRADPNFQKLQAVDKSDPTFAHALDIAALALAGALKDMTGGATHYHAISITPYWAKGKNPSVTIGNHAFYRML